MLKLVNVSKTYISGDEKVGALNGVSINFRKNEFVSILGPSGCGKTTLLNIIGGLDQYTDGDLVINGKSTRNFTDRDFDTYRNHSIGFVFQSYNLIPHQSVLSNVELALTLSGVSRAERRRRALEALEKVGLADQIKKKPNQMSGGQMQRVAIARALVNDPDILLADEPTGALDSETSIQIMDILREIAKDKLVIMVTHNPDLAEEYSTRIIRVLDGKVQSDSDPFDGEKYDTPEVSEKKRNKSEKTTRKTSMSFLTALSLSFNNLMTKKARTFMTSFAGSIGIIGIALILSVSTGVNAYINQVQEETLISYPLTINAESDVSNILANFMSAQAEDAAESKEDGYVYSRDVMYDMMNSMTQRESNNLTDFKKYLEKEDEEIKKYASSIRYGYGTKLSVYTKDPDGKIVACNMEEMMESIYQNMGIDQGSASSYSSTMMSMGSFDLWQEMIPGENGEFISPSITEQYDVIYGDWPKNYNEAVLVVSEHNEISDYALYGLGLKPFDNMIEIMYGSMKGESVELKGEDKWTYEDILNKEYRLVLDSDKFAYQADENVYLDRTKNERGLKTLYANDELSERIKIVGIIRASEDANGASITGAIAYPSALTDYIIKESGESELIKKQLDNKEIDVLTNLPFEVELTDEEKIERIKSYADSLEGEEKRALYLQFICTPSDDYVASKTAEYEKNYDREMYQQMLLNMYMTQNTENPENDSAFIQEYFVSMSDEEFKTEFFNNLPDIINAQYAAQEAAKYAMESFEVIEAKVAKTDADYLKYYELYMPREFSDSTYEDNLKALGYVNLDTPTSISIYVNTFDNKDKVNEFIAKYNEGVSEEDQIKYTDYFAILMSGISTVINAISYVLIAFVAISLVVSSIMIGIITYISVLERTKEIGILRAIGASKKDIARVFNAETITVGFVAGLIGIIVTLLLLIPINAIIHYLTGISTLTAVLPIGAAVILVLISMALTVIAGLFPSRVAAKKDPVVALRTE
ncbi:MAG: ABC transporter ATP-binding protein/permease [Clostridia bacterium]|nr:ABC transporter ATP-binding protein/permease [Clostridia bacterium]